MQKHIGDCDGCGGTDVVIYHGWSTRASKLCRGCNGKRLRAAQKDKAKQSPPKAKIVRQSASIQRTPISKKPSPRLVGMRDEDWVIGLEIWAERPHNCVECGKFLPEDEDGLPIKVYFSHVLSKGAHPELRFDAMNIVLHCPDCHRFWETSGKMREMKTYALHFPYMQQNGFTQKD